MALSGGRYIRTADGRLISEQEAPAAPELDVTEQESTADDNDADAEKGSLGES